MAWKDIYELSVKEKAEHERKYGAYNDFPPGWREISQEEMAQSNFFTYSPVLVEDRQMYPRDENGEREFNKGRVSARLFHMHDGTGFGLGSDYWGKKIQWYRFELCNHDYAGTTIGKCLTRYTCKKCNYSEEIDSSD